MIFKRIALVVAGVSALTNGGPAHAETLSFDVLLPAKAELPGNVEQIATERFTGRGGGDLELAITQALGAVRIQGQSWFRILPKGSPLADEQPDAVLRGSLRGNVDEREVNSRIEEQCVERDENDRCVRREKVDVPCWEVTLRLNPRVLLVTMDGQQLYSRSSPFVKTQRYCETENPPSIDAMGDALIEDIARAVRFDLAPVDRSIAVRIMERRKGLKGDARDAFRAAVKLTNSNQSAACDAFERLMGDYPEQSSILFNTGLCKERKGELEAARALYRETLRVDPGRDYAQQGLRRVADRERARIQVKRGLGEASAE